MIKPSSEDNELLGPMAMRETEITYDTTRRAINRKDIWEGTSLSQSGENNNSYTDWITLLSMAISVLFPVWSRHAWARCWVEWPIPLCRRKEPSDSSDRIRLLLNEKMVMKIIRIANLPGQWQHLPPLAQSPRQPPCPTSAGWKVNEMDVDVNNKPIFHVRINRSLCTEHLMERN